MRQFESFKLAETEHPLSFLYTDSAMREEAFDADGKLVYEKWESLWYSVELSGAPDMPGVPFRVECTPRGALFDIAVSPARAESGGGAFFRVEPHGVAPLYEPAELVGAISGLEDEAVHAVEACALVEQRVPELFPGYIAYTPRPRRARLADDVPCRIDDLKVVRHEQGEHGEAIVFGSDWLHVVFTRFGESLLDVSLRCSHLQMEIEAHPQPVDGYMEPVLFVRPRLEFADYKQIEPTMERYRAEASIAVELCDFLRRKVDELFPDFIL